MSDLARKRVQQDCETAAISLFYQLHDVDGHDIREIQVVEPGCDVVCDSCDFRVELHVEGGEA